jgi:hypothetical protein
VKWNPIPGCEDFGVATRRAEALMKGVEDSSQTQDNAAAKYFEEVAAAVVAAMLHAAALAGDIELDDIGGWISTSTYAPPGQHPGGGGHGADSHPRRGTGGPDGYPEVPGQGRR